MPQGEDDMHIGIVGLFFLMVASAGSNVAAQSYPTAQTTSDVVLYSAKSTNSAGVVTLPSGQQIIIIPPKSVTIGKGVTIGQGVLIEGKPWHQVQLPNGQSGYLAGSVICSPSVHIAGTAGICPIQ